MTFNEQDVQRGTDGRFAEKVGTSPEAFLPGEKTMDWSGAQELDEDRELWCNEHGGWHYPPGDPSCEFVV